MESKGTSDEMLSHDFVYLFIWHDVWFTERAFSVVVSGSCGHNY